MLTPRLGLALIGCMLLNLNLTTCRSPGDSESSPPASTERPRQTVELPGVDTKDLTPREKAEWSAHVSELLSPCESVPVSVAECVQKERPCSACLPAAEFLLTKVKHGMSRGQVAQAYENRFSSKKAKEIDLSGSPSRGPTDSRLVIVEFADFECPACRAVSPALDEIVEKNPDVRFVFKNFPLPIHQNAETAARAALAADLQGKFWEMHHELFSSDVPPTKERTLELARKIGLDVVRFEKDLRSEAIADAVRRDRKHGEQLDLKGTPSIFINGRAFEFSMDLKRELGEWLELERKLNEEKTAKKPAAPAPAAPAPAAPAPAAPETGKSPAP
jgi:protein-disulfide isomerase